MSVQRVNVPQDGDSIAVWFSCGVASAVAAKLTVENYGQRCDVHVVNNPIAEEDADNRRFLSDVEAWLGVEIQQAKSKAYPTQSAVEVWDRRRYMSGIRGAPCTYELKKRARQEWEMVVRPDWTVLGFTVDEIRRHEAFSRSERELLPVLIDAGLSKSACHRIIAEAGIAPPRVYRMGFPNANCIGCVKATSASYWSLVREVFPDVFFARAAQSRALGVRLARYRGRRIFLDELPAVAMRRKLKQTPDCGLFCEERL
jgi:hypothetical protein